MKPRPAAALSFALSLVATACAGTPAATVDAGDDTSVDAAPGPCGVSSLGECVGDTLVRCEGVERVEQRCDAAGGRCARFQGYAACAVPTGASCRTVIDHGSHQHLVFDLCLAADAACASGDDTGVCLAGFGACTPADVGTCRDDHYVANCRAGQAVTVDCRDHGGRCDPTGAACVAIPEGRTCDTTRRRCATGLVCRLPTRRALFGRCERPAP